MANNQLNRWFATFLSIISAFFACTAMAVDFIIVHPLWGHNDFLNNLAKQYNNQKNEIQLQFKYHEVHEIDSGIHSDASSLSALLMPSDKLGNNSFKFMPLPQSWIPNTVKSDYLETVKKGGLTYGIPIAGGNHLVLFYNKKYISNPAQSWQELLEQNQRLVSSGKRLMGWPTHSPYYFVSFLPAFGGALFEQGKPAFDTPQNIDALKFYKQLYDRDIVLKNCEMACGKDDFHSEKVLYSIDIDAAFKENLKHLGKDLGVALLPTFDNQPMGSLFSTLALYLPYQSFTTEQEANIKRIVDYLLSPMIQEKFVLEEHIMPVHSGIEEQLERLGDHAAAIMLQQLKRSKPMPPSLEMHRIWIKMGELLPVFLEGDVTAQELAKQVQAFAVN